VSTNNGRRQGGDLCLHRQGVGEEVAAFVEDRISAHQARLGPFVKAVNDGASASNSNFAALSNRLARLEQTVARLVESNNALVATVAELRARPRRTRREVIRDKEGNVVAVEDVATDEPRGRIGFQAAEGDA
jgi:hypothetical protein